MTPLGHLAVAYGLGSVQKKAVGNSGLPYVIVGGLAPDVDFLLIGIKSFNTLHRSLTHNLFFVLTVAALCVLFVHFRCAGRGAQLSGVFLLMVFLSAVAGGLSHLFVDGILDSNASNGMGVAALWPLSERFFSPFNLAPQRCPSWEKPLTAILCNLPLILWELPFYLLAALLWWRTHKAARRHTETKHKEKVRL